MCFSILTCNYPITICPFRLYEFSFLYHLCWNSLLLLYLQQVYGTWYTGFFINNSLDNCLFTAGVWFMSSCSSILISVTIHSGCVISIIRPSFYLKILHNNLFVTASMYSFVILTLWQFLSLLTVTATRTALCIMQNVVWHLCHTSPLLWFCFLFSVY